MRQFGLHRSDHLTQYSNHPTRYPKELSMSKIAITSPELTPPVGPFSQAIKVDGFIYFSGPVAQDPTTGKLVTAGSEAETARGFQNLSAVLSAGGMGNVDMGADHASREEFGADHRLQGLPGLSKITGSAQRVSGDHFQKHGGLCGGHRRYRPGIRSSDRESHL